MAFPKVVTFGEVMMRLTPPGYQRILQAQSYGITFGGGDANVAISLAHFGVPAEHVTRFPAHDLGQAATAFLRWHGLETSHIVYGGKRLGLYFYEQGAISRASKVVYDRADSSFADITPGMIDWEAVFAGAGWFHWTGITPAISQGAADALLEGLKVAKAKGLTISADVNYRKNLWQYGKKAEEVMPTLTEYCDLIFASRKDMEEMYAVKAEETGDKFSSVARQVMDRYPRIKRVVNTKRGSVSANHNILSAMLFNGEVLIKTDTMEINPIVDRIGGGDAFCAGLIYGLLAYGDEEKALNFALAASVLKHAVEGDANIVSVAEVELVASGDTSGKLSR